MPTPETDTVQQNGNQVATESQTQPQQTAPDQSGSDTTSTQQETTGQFPSYFESEEALRKKIDELTSIAETGDFDDVFNAKKEMDDIEQVLLRAKKRPKQPPAQQQQSQQPSTEPQSQQQQVDDGGTEPKGEPPKKFTVHWQGNRIERDDVNSLLGYENTGQLKAALIKSELREKDRDQQINDLSRRLREAEEKLNKPPAQSQQPFQQPQQQQPQFQPPAQSVQVPQRPVPPGDPTLSTNDPALYTDDDLKAIADHQKATSKFSKDIVEYMSYLENKPVPQQDTGWKNELNSVREELKQTKETLKSYEDEKKNLANEKAEIAHWKRFSDFQDIHESFKTPKNIKDFNDEMVQWMDNVAVANGVQKPFDGYTDDYLRQRWSVVDRYLQNDPAVVQNSQGYQPPEGHETFFKLLDLSAALSRYKNDGVLGPNATLEDAYDRMKRDSGEMQEAIDTVRTDERVNAAQQFANGVEQLQQNAVNIDPSVSSGGPDLNELGVSSEDLRWFRSVKPEQYHQMQNRSPEDFKKYNAIAAKLEAFARR